MLNYKHHQLDKGNEKKKHGHGLLTVSVSVINSYILHLFLTCKDFDFFVFIPTTESCKLYFSDIYEAKVLLRNVFSFLLNKYLIMFCI